MTEDTFYCHVHNADNQRIGSGEGENEADALMGAAVDAGDEATFNDKGSWGCGTSPEDAHRNAKEAHSVEPGQDIFEARMD